ncbi:hypothetical protein [Bacillus velezensis]|nr:hypothetical protein [Bacillus velezensis]
MDAYSFSVALLFLYNDFLIEGGIFWIRKVFALIEILVEFIDSQR